MKHTLMLLSAVSLACATATVGAAGDPAAGEQKAQICASCHGADGNSESGQFPMLAGQYPSYIVKALEDYQSGARKDPVMAGFAATLSHQDRQDLAAYFSRQTGLSVVEE